MLLGDAQKTETSSELIFTEATSEFDDVFQGNAKIYEAGAASIGAHQPAQRAFPFDLDINLSSGRDKAPYRSILTEHIARSIDTLSCIHGHQNGKEASSGKSLQQHTYGGFPRTTPQAR